eukprot:4295070-Amphidinium_carterae.4
MELIAALRKRVEQKKGIPQLIMGDFQTDIRSQLVMRDMFHDGWLSSTCFAEVTHTNISATGMKRILDDILLSPEVAQRFVSIEVNLVKLDPGVTPDRSGWRLPKPCITDPSNWGKVAHKNGLTHELWWKEQLHSFPRHSTQAMFDYWVTCFNSWLDIQDPNDETYALRGRCGSYFTSELGGRGAPAIQGAAWKIHILKKAVAYTEEFKAQMDSAAPCVDRCDLLASKFGNFPLAFFNLESTHLDAESVDQLFATLSSSLKSTCDEQTSGLETWKAKMLASAWQGSRAVYSWLKYGAECISIVVHNDLYHVHPSHILSCLSDFWTTVLCTNEEVDDAIVQEAVTPIGYHPFVVPPCSADLLYEACRQRKNSSNGLDDIDLAELASLPVAAWEMLSIMIQEIESGAPWPSQLLQVKLSPIPKKKGRAHVASGKVRLIAITSPTVCGGIRGRGTFDILADVALTWHESLQADQGDPRSQFAHLTLDASRCFDTLSYEALIEIARLVGVPPEVCVHFLAYLRGHKRQLVTKGWLGPTISPTRGLPQGDSLSVFMCVLWGIAACKSIEAMTAGNVQVAVYMDDISIMATCASELHLASGAAALFMNNWHVQLNISKCTIAMSVQAQRLWACDLEMSLANTFRLLGVEIGHSHSGEIMLERINEADSRLDRIMCLPGAPGHQEEADCQLRLPSSLWFGASALDALGMLLPAIGVCYGAHLWMPHAWSIAEMSRVIHTIASSPSGKARLARLTSGFSSQRESSPLIDGWISWCKTFGGEATEADVCVDDRVVLHSSLSSSAWKHEVRHLHRVTSIFRVNRQSRNLVNLEPHSLDAYLLHHVLCTDHEDHGVETFATGGVNSRDRLFRHSKGLLDSANCEHACVDHHSEPLRDTPIHRAYFCSISEEIRAAVGWTREEEDLVFHEGNACVSYGLAPSLMLLEGPSQHRDGHHQC